MNKSDYQASIVGLLVTSNTGLYLLANLFELPFDAEDITSIIYKFQHKPEVIWEPIYNHYSWITSICSKDDGKLIAVDMNGNFHYNSGRKWELISTTCINGFNAVISDDTKTFAISVDGEIAVLTNNKIEIISNWIGNRLNAISLTRTKEVWAVGDSGLIVKFNGIDWSKFPSPTVENLISIYVTGKNDIYLGGAGILLIWNGRNWVTIKDFQVTIYSITGFNDCIYFACGKDGVYCFQNSSIVFVKALEVYKITTINNAMYAFGNRLMAQFNGSEWWGGQVEL